MGLALFQERRFEARKKLTGLLPGRLRSFSGEDIVCRPVDVSDLGLGIISAQKLEVNARLQLLIKNKVIELTVAWVRPDFVKRDMSRYGLVATDKAIDLREEFLNAGCLK